MSYTALYREWRPQNFDQVVGQAHVVRTLTNALGDDKLSHAYLFAGPRGTGKTSIARILARAINCEEGPTTSPCGKCPSCLSISAGTAMDVIEIDAASNRGINEIRDLREKVRYSPAHSRHKVYIIDEVHMLTPEAFNALLKTLEDPPGHVFFIMATTESHKIPLTILSRLQRFDFHRLKTQEIVERLKEVCRDQGILADDATLQGIARHADGALRDALGLLDQCRSFAGNEVTLEDIAQVLGTAGSDLLLEMADAIRQGRLGDCLELLVQAEDAGKDMRVLTRDLLVHFRNLMVLQAAGSQSSISQGLDQAVAEQASCFDPRATLAIIDALSEAEGRMRTSPHPRILLEVVIMGIMVRQGFLSAQSAPTVLKEESPTPASEPGPQKTPEAADSAPKESQADKLVEADEQKVWEAFRQELKRVRRGLYALLEPARLVSAVDSRFTIAFPGEYTFHKERTEENKRMMLEILAGVAGRECRIECTLASSSSSASSAEREEKVAEDGSKAPAPSRAASEIQADSPQEASREAAASDPPATQEQEAIDIFGGRMVEHSDKRRE